MARLRSVGAWLLPEHPARGSAQDPALEKAVLLGPELQASSLAARVLVPGSIQRIRQLWVPTGLPIAESEYPEETGAQRPIHLGGGEGAAPGRMWLRLLLPAQLGGRRL